MNKLLIFIILLFCWSCASQTTPTGGPKDETPPKLLKTSPANGSINNKTSTIELDFNELIILDKPKDQIIISPFEKDVEYTYRKNTAILKFKNPLKDSTTYTITFREAIKDITEKNPAIDVQLAFSTGPYIDSLSVSGVCYDIINGKYLNNVTVALQPLSDTFNLFKHKTRLITKTNPETGQFKFTNLKPGNYQLYAFTDKNNNLIVDSQTEFYAYKKEPIRLVNNIDSAILPLVKLDNRPLKIVSMRDVQNFYSVKLNKGYETVKLKTDNPSILLTNNDNNTTVRLYALTKTDSALVNLEITDTAQQTLDTTFYAVFKQDYDPKRKEKFKTEFNDVNQYLKSNLLSTKLTFTKPLLFINTDSLFIRYDSISRETISLSDLRYDTANLTLTLTKTLVHFKPEKPDKSKEQPAKKKTPNQPILYFGKGSLVSIDNDSLSVKKLEINQIKEEDLAKIFIQPEKENQIFELLTTKGNVVLKNKGLKDIAFEEVKPGDYQLRMIVDLNNNGKWDPAFPSLQREAEPVYYYYNDEGSPTFFVKANWDYGPLLIKPTLPVDKLSKDNKKTTKQ
ncbi:MAG: Ig-like domain-containing protein [Chryseotalea sp.]